MDRWLSLVEGARPGARMRWLKRMNQVFRVRESEYEQTAIFLCQFLNLLWGLPRNPEKNRQ